MFKRLIPFGLLVALALGVAGNYLYALDPLRAIGEVVGLIVADALLVRIVALVSAAVLVVIVIVAVRQALSPKASALSWQGRLGPAAEWDAARTQATLRLSLTAGADRDVRMESARVVAGVGRVAEEQPRKGVSRGGTYTLVLAFGPLSASGPSQAYALLEQRYRVPGEFRSRLSRVLVHLVCRWGLAGDDVLVLPFDDDFRVTEARITEECDRHFSQNDAWYRQAWGTSPRVVPMVELRPSTGASPDLRVEVLNRGIAAAEFRGRCRVLAARHDGSGQAFRSGSYMLPWTHTSSCSTKIVAEGAATLVIASWEMWHEAGFAEVRFFECRGDGSSLFADRRWGLDETGPLPQFDIEIAIETEDHVVLAARYVLRPAKRFGPLEFVPLAGAPDSTVVARS